MRKLHTDELVNEMTLVALGVNYGTEERSFKSK
jgi:hypothetical protein